MEVGKGMRRLLTRNAPRINDIRPEMIKYTGKEEVYNICVFYTITYSYTRILVPWDKISDDIYQYTKKGRLLTVTISEDHHSYAEANPGH